METKQNTRRELYQKFQEAFPIEFLKEMPLERYTNLNRDDSFCYWVESKTVSLGSFWGGSSYKFGIYKYNQRPNEHDPRVKSDDAYAWYSKYNKGTASEAYELVRNTIVEIAQHARKKEFDAIDKITALGDAFKWKIAFLYSEESLIPIYKKEMLNIVAASFGMDDANKKSVVEIQSFLMEQKGDGDLYEFYDKLLAVYDAAVGEETKKLGEEKPVEVKYWMYSPGEGACKWELCQKDGIMCIGWSEIGDLMQYNNAEEIKEALKGTFGSDESYKNSGLAVWEFSHVMKPGDIVYVKLGRKKIMGRGVVTSDYIFDEEYEEFGNVRKVDWTNVGLWDAPHDSAMKTLTDITKYPKYVEELEAIFNNKEIDVKRYWWLVAKPKIWSMQSMAVGETIEYSLYSDLGKQRRVFQNFLDAKVGDAVIGYEATPTKKIVALLEVAKASDGKSIWLRKVESLASPISYGAIKDMPELAEMQFLNNPQGSFFRLTADEYEALLDVVREDNPVREVKESAPYGKAGFMSEVFMSSENYDKLKNLLLAKKNIILQGAPGVGKTFSAKRLAYSILGKKDESKIELVQFHQNYSYEDFVMGYKPKEEGGFELKRGVFYNFCMKAASDPKNCYFFIIDEINRGNLSKIFGELLMLIESDYRNTSIKLAYSDEPFAVPENMYVIGMMNTADRSLAMIDYALRRRFSFYDMKPGFETEGFRAYRESLQSEKFNKVIDGIVELNKTIEGDDSLGAGFCIGHSYFCNQKQMDEAWLSNVIEFDIIPMLREYWFDNDKKYKEEAGKLIDLLR